MSYASTTDLTTYGLPATALPATITLGQRQGALDTASARIDSYLRGRYRLPLVAWGAEITKACAVMAAYELMTIRGWNPENAGDDALRMRNDEMILWLRDVQRQAAHPDVTESPTSTAAPIVRPNLISTSTASVGLSGATSTNRGW